MSKRRWAGRDKQAGLSRQVCALFVLHCLLLVQSYSFVQPAALMSSLAFVAHRWWVHAPSACVEVTRSAHTRVGRPGSLSNYLHAIRFTHCGTRCV